MPVVRIASLAVFRLPATHPVVLALDTETHLRRLGLDNELVVAVWAVLVFLLKVPKM